MQSLFTRVLAVAAVGVFALGIASTQSKAQSITSDLAKASLLEVIKKRGVFKVGITSFVPWSMRDKKGELIGFEVDVATKVAEGMGVKLQLMPTQFAGIIPALLAGTFDTIITGIATTPKRNLQINFTIPYQTYGSTLTISRKAMPGVKAWSELNKASVTFATRRGGTGVDAIRKNFPKVKIIQYDDDAQAFQDVINGNATAISSPKPKPEFYTKAYSDSLYQVPDEGFLNGTVLNSGFALRKGDPDMLNFLDNWIRYHHTSGFLGERNAYWFNSDNWFDLVEASKNKYDSSNLKKK